MAYNRGQSRNIIVGAAAVFVGPGGTALPDLDALVGGATTTPRATEVLSASTDFGGEDGNGVGFTSEGVEVSYEPTFGDIEVDQLLDSARLFKQQMRVTVNTSFAEATLENLIVVWGQAEGSLDNTTKTHEAVLDIELGELGESPLERTMVFVGPSPLSSTPTATGNSQNKERVYHLTRAIQTESTSHALRRNEGTMLPASFRVLPDTSAGAGRYGTVRDRIYGRAPTP